MNKNVFFSTCILILLVSNVQNAGGKEDANPKTDPNLEFPLFAQVKFLNLAEICNSHPVNNFDVWYQGWIMKKVTTKRFLGPSEINSGLLQEISDHNKELQKYLKAFLERSKNMMKYANTYFDIEVNNLINDAHLILRTPFKNKFHLPATQTQLKKELGHYAPNLISSAINEFFNQDLIRKVGEVFWIEYKKHKKTPNVDLEPILDQHVRDIIKTLYLILDIFGNNKQEKTYKKLNANDKASLQSFYDTFHPLLDKEEVRKLIFKMLTGEERSLPQSNPFFVPELFNHLLRYKNDFNPTFNRDMFLTLYKPDYTLEELNQASKDVMFSWPMLPVFESAPMSLVANKQGTNPINKQERKKVRVHQILYLVYTFARNDRTLMPSDSTDLVSIMRKLYSWVIDTKIFNDMEPTKDGIVVNEHVQIHEVLQPEKFKRYFIPLISLICTHIPGCVLDKSEKKNEIVDRFIQFKNFEDFKDREGLKSILPPGILDKIEQQAVFKQAKTLIEKLDELEDAHGHQFNEDPTEDFEDFEIDELPVGSDPNAKSEKKSPKGKRRDRKSRSSKSVNDKTQELDGEFNKFVGKFLDPSHPDEEHKNKQLLTVLGVIEGSDNDKKKNMMRTLLIKLLLKKQQTEPKNVEKMIKTLTLKFLQKLSAELRYDALDGLRNFFFGTLSRELGDFYSPKTTDDEYTYSLDLVTFLELAPYVEAQQIKKNVNMPDKTRNEKIAELLKQRTEGAKALTFGMSDKKPVHKSFQAIAQNRMKMINERFGENPLFLEKKFGIDLLHGLRDFFSYYIISKNENSQAVTANYYKVFLNFYTFLAHIRRGIIQKINDPHSFVLKNLEGCLKYTQNRDSWDSENEQHEVCKFSHRKYAEMLFFYKSFLVSAKKTDFKFDEHIDKSFNVHTRQFLVFSQHNGVYEKVLSDQCTNDDQLAICVSWKLYNRVVAYLQNSETSENSLVSYVQNLKSIGSAFAKINAINGLEAAFLHSQQSNPADYSKHSTFLSFNLNDDTPIKRLLRFNSEDEVELARYLDRTYKKLTLLPEERNLSILIQTIFSGKEDLENPRDDTLLSFLMHADIFVPFYLKLFLQYATTDDHFRRVARVLIKHSISMELVKLNDITKDDFFLSFVSLVSDLPTEQLKEQGFRLFHTKLQKEYEKVILLCKTITTKEIQADLLAQGDEELDLDLLGDFVLEEETEETSSYFETKLEPQLKEEVIEIIIEMKFDQEVSLTEIDNRIRQYHSKLLESDVHIKGIEQTIQMTNEDKSVETYAVQTTNDPTSIKMEFGGMVIDPNQGEILINMSSQMKDRVTKQIENKEKEIASNPQKNQLNLKDQKESTSGNIVIQLKPTRIATFVSPNQNSTFDRKAKIEALKAILTTFKPIPKGHRGYQNPANNLKKKYIKIKNKLI